MASGVIAAARWLRRRAENLAALLLGTMFIAFLVQIVFRYIFNWPAGWAFELTILCWLWGVLFGAAFIVGEKDEIRFDVVISGVHPSARRWMAVVGGLALLAIYGMSLPAVYEYVAFMKVERTAYLRLPFDWVYSIYVIFAVAILVRYAWLVWRSLRGPAAKAPEAPGGP